MVRNRGVAGDGSTFAGVYNLIGERLNWFDERLPLTLQMEEEVCRVRGLARRSVGLESTLYL